MVTHFTLVVWATAGDASDARRSTTVHMGGSAACVKDVRKRDEEAPWRQRGVRSMKRRRCESAVVAPTFWGRYSAT